MANEFTHDQYISPFTWRYGSEKMREIFSEHNKRLLLREIWIAIAKAQQKANLVTQQQVDDLIAHKEQIDIARATEIESVIKHDLMAEIKTYAEQCKIGGSIIHLGATSMDVLDNMDVLRQKEALLVVINNLKELLKSFVKQMKENLSVPTIAFTHIQPAEVTTIGYRLAFTAQDLLADLDDLTNLYDNLKGKGLKGAVGSGASYESLLENSDIDAMAFENEVTTSLNLKPFLVASQVYPRKQDYRLAVALASLSATLAKFALDLRVLQSPPIGEWSEPFAPDQVGSSAMPFKRNPITSEKINSLCRFVASQVGILWENSANSILERTLDDSANRRVVIPEMFLATDEVLNSTNRLVKNLVFDFEKIEQNLNRYGMFAATEKVLMKAASKGGDRQLLHEVIRKHSLDAWPLVQQGKDNPLATTLSKEKEILKYLSEKEIINLMSATNYVGNSEKRTLLLIKEIEEKIK